MYAKSLRLETGLALPAKSIPRVLDLVVEGRFDPGIVTTLNVGWEDAPAALVEHTTKVIVQRDRVFGVGGSARTLAQDETRRGS
ncbi:MAG: hypothetical protein ACFB9M_05465 [Myxococcota bacterium]